MGLHEMVVARTPMGARFVDDRKAAVFLLLLSQVVVFAQSKDDGHVGGAQRLRRVQQTAQIAGGEDAPCGRYPFMVSLLDRENRHQCGGVLVHPEWVLTAAHCVDPNNGESLGATPIIVIGACNLEDTENENGAVETMLARDAAIHEEWSGEVAEGNDIALLRLSKTSSHVPVGLPSSIHSLKGGERLVALGWGKQEIGSDRNRKQLQQANPVEFVRSALCNASSEASWDGILQESMLCAYSFTGQQVCKGDSGGPLLQAHAPGSDVSAGNPGLDIIVGITSFGDDAECGSSERPDVFTKVASFHAWIEGKLQGVPPSPIESPKPAPPLLPIVSPEPPLPPPPEPNSAVQAVQLSPIESPEPASPPLLPPPEPTPRLSSEEQEMLDKALLELARSAENSTTEALVTGLLLRGANPNTACCESFRGRSALHESCQKDNAIVAQALLTAGADTEAGDSFEYTPLHTAVFFKAVRVARVLIDGEADMEAGDFFGQTPLFISVYQDDNRQEVLDVLHVVEVLVDSGADVNTRQKTGSTPLHKAASRGNVELAEFLVVAGADKAAENDSGLTPGDGICDEESCGSDEIEALESLLL